MPIHNVNASMSNLARAQLQAVDRAQINHTLPTATFILLMETLIDLTETKPESETRDAGSRTIMGHMARMSDAR
jgi:hypothetical protein